MTYRGEEYSVKLKKYYFCNGTIKHVFDGGDGGREKN